MRRGRPPLDKPRDWRVRWRWVRGPRFARVIDRLPEGTVYRFWCGWVLVTVMVKGEPRCTSGRFGKRMYCYFGESSICVYCGLPPTARTPEQEVLIEAGRLESWWR